MERHKTPTVRKKDMRLALESLLQLQEKVHYVPWSSFTAGAVYQWFDRENDRKKGRDRKMAFSACLIEAERKGFVEKTVGYRAWKRWGVRENFKLAPITLYRVPEDKIGKVRAFIDGGQDENEQ